MTKVVRAEVYEPDESLPRDLVALRRFAQLMDNAVQIPGTKRGFGLDAALGLIPGFGDAAGAIFSLWIIVGALRHRVPFGVVARMTGAILVDLVVGAIPVIGDVFDFLFTENIQNVELLIHHRNRQRAPRGVREAATVLGFILAAVVVLVFAAIVTTVIIAIVALRSRT